jgi:hypothetical protein
MNATTVFEVGDLVEATKKIWRVDYKATLHPGDKATVFRVFRVDPNSPQIVALRDKNGCILCDIVCDDTVPFRKV